MDKALRKKVDTVVDWAERNRQPLVAEVIKQLASQVEQLEEQVKAQHEQAIAAAMSTLTYSEREAMKRFLSELEGDKGLLVASKIADACGITRSVIVNGLRKLESAGVIRSRSLGMKGTRVELLVPEIRQALIS